MHLKIKKSINDVCRLNTGTYEKVKLLVELTDSLAKNGKNPESKSGNESKRFTSDYVRRQKRFDRKINHTSRFTLIKIGTTYMVKNIRTPIRNYIPRSKMLAIFHICQPLGGTT